MDAAILATFLSVPVTRESFPAPPENLCFDSVRLKFTHLVPGDATRGLVPFYYFRILIPGREAGHITFKVGDTEHVRLYVGHIGYGVDEACRGNGLAYQACRAVAPFVGLFYKSVILTSDPDNPASLRTIERLGAKFLDEVLVPPHDVQYREGSRNVKRRYSWTP